MSLVEQERSNAIKLARALREVEALADSMFGDGLTGDLGDAVVGVLQQAKWGARAIEEAIEKE